ncbi:MAG: MerR family transcriptional regulator [Myxococcota bacterium]
MTRPTPTWRIGELAAATGTTVRTLHHYEHLGLLEPAERSEGNHRIYTERDVQRLYRIRALRELGVPLAGIRTLLDSTSATLPSVLSAHLQRVRDERARLKRLEARLVALGSHADGAAPEAILDALAAMARLERHVASGPPPTGETRWRALGDAFRAHLDAGDPPGAPAVLELAREARRGIESFARADREVVEALGVVRRVAPPAELAGWDPPLFAYLDLALAALMESDHE